MTIAFARLIGSTVTSRRLAEAGLPFTRYDHSRRGQRWGSIRIQDKDSFSPLGGTHPHFFHSLSNDQCTASSDLSRE